MHETYRDFDSREDFIRSLSLYHNDPTVRPGQDFSLIGKVVSNYQSELYNIRSNINLIKQSWHDQSIAAIEKSVSQLGHRQLEIMAGQKKDKLNAGYDIKQPMYRVHKVPCHSIFLLVAKKLGLDHAIGRYHVQFPGEVTTWHTDIFAPAQEFLPDFIQNIQDDQIGQDLGIRRIIVALEDWHWGQCMMFGTSVWHQWQAGDIIFWNYGMPHCAANAGFEPRIFASITGLATEDFWNNVKDQKNY